MQDRINRIFGEAYLRNNDDDVLNRGDWRPPVDIYENDKHEIVLRAELPGLKREDLDIRVENNTLTLRGERKRDAEVKQESYHRVERTYGAFSRSFSLPDHGQHREGAGHLRRRRADHHAADARGSRSRGRFRCRSTKFPMHISRTVPDPTRRTDGALATRPERRHDYRLTLRRPDAPTVRPHLVRSRWHFLRPYLTTLTGDIQQPRTGRAP